MRTAAKKVLSLFPYLRKHFDYHFYLVKCRDKCGYEPGHYYSPIPDLSSLRDSTEKIFNHQPPADIDLNTGVQLQVLEEVKHFYNEYPYLSTNSTGNLRYNKTEAWYRFSDAVFLYSMIRKFRPKRIIEVGSGHSSAIMLDTNEIFLNHSCSFVFIEPFPEERLNKVLTEKDKTIAQVIPSKVQDVDLQLFESLGDGDILFVDSTHVSKVGSDLNYLLFEVLPSLSAGVLIHFHDIFYPFEMREHWVMDRKWFWNENYLLRAFLMNNHDYEIVNFNSYLQHRDRNWFEENMPECLISDEDTGSIWIRKLHSTGSHIQIPKQVASASLN